MRIIDSLKGLAVPIDSLKPDPRNARLHPERNLEALRNSLRYYGQRKPIVVRKDDSRIIAGNGLWQAAKDLGWTEIAAVFVDDDDAAATGYALMDNQSAILAEWDFDRLGELVTELQDMDFDLDLTGFSADQLHILSASWEGPSAPTGVEPDEDIIGNVQQRYIVWLSFSTREAAEEWLAEQGIERRFTGRSTQIAVDMG